MAKEVLLAPRIHFDPAWRRCFERTARRGGLAVRSYAQIEERCFDWLAQAGSEPVGGRPGAAPDLVGLPPDVANVPVVEAAGIVLPSCNR